MSEPAKGRLPVTVIGGYLGAGKTTLVNRLLRKADGLRVAVMVNDFGDLPIDRDLIEAADGDTMDIAGGCVCCSYGSDLMAALMDLPKRRPDIEHVLLETSGVALPGMVASALGLLADYVLDGVLVMADAETVEGHAADRYLGDTILRQLAAADLVVLNKSDLVSERDLQKTASWLAPQAPRATVVATARADIPVEAAFGLRLHPPANRAATLLAPGAVDAATLFESASYAVDDGLDVDGLAVALADPAMGLIRAKGFVRDGEGRARSIQAVGRRVEVADAHEAAASGRLVVIGLRGKLDRVRLESALRRRC